MAGTTTNNGWTYPTSTDLVTNGASAIQTLATGIDTSTGKGLIASQSWSPVLSSGWLNGNGTWNADYFKLGKMVFFAATFTIGSTTTKGTGLIMSLPVTATGNSASLYWGLATIGGVGYQLVTARTTTTTLSLQALDASATYLKRTGVTSAIPATWATGDSFTVQGMYEAA